jgi:hypothetical protein
VAGTVDASEGEADATANEGMYPKPLSSLETETRCGCKVYLVLYRKS